MGEDEIQAVEEDAAAQPFSVDDIVVLGDTIPKRWVTVPEWRVMKEGKLVKDGRVCVWGTSLKETGAIEEDAAVGTKMNDRKAAFERRMVATIIECVRKGDGSDEYPDTAPMFNRGIHWSWLAKQPSSVINLLYTTVQELDMSDGTKIEQVLSFFAMMSSLRGCLQHIASHCDACTDCLQNSQATCPQQLLTLLS